MKYLNTIFKVLILLPVIINIIGFVEYQFRSVNTFTIGTIVLCVLTIKGIDSKTPWIQKLCILIGSIIIILLFFVMFAVFSLLKE